MEKITNFLKHPLTLVVCRWVLGLIFIVASIYKIAAPAEFARAIYNYQILPDILINPIALVLPWIELICGIFLIVGFYTAGSIRLVTAMLVVFIVALSINLVRGVDIDCGCFSAGSGEGNAITQAIDTITILTMGEGGLSSTLIRDIIWLLMAIPVLIFQDRWLSIDQWRRSKKLNEHA